MRTTLNLNEDLVREAMKVTGIQEKTKLLHVARRWAGFNCWYVANALPMGALLLLTHIKLAWLQHMPATK